MLGMTQLPSLARLNVHAVAPTNGALFRETHEDVVKEKVNELLTMVVTDDKGQMAFRPDKTTESDALIDEIIRNSNSATIARGIDIVFTKSVQDVYARHLIDFNNPKQRFVLEVLNAKLEAELTR